MTAVFQQIIEIFEAEAAGAIVPRSGINAALTGFSAAAMAFLAVFAIALALTAGQLAQRWSDELAGHATIRIVAPQNEIENRTAAVLQMLEATPGVTFARALDQEEQRDLLAPWFGADLPVHMLSLPQLIEVHHEGREFDADTFGQRLTEQVPEALLDDHTRWQQPLAAASKRLRGVAFLSFVLSFGVTAAVIALAAQGALAANAQIISVLRLIGARDSFIEAAFVRRFTLRAVFGAAAGGLVGALAVSILPGSQPEGALLAGLGLNGWQWIWLFLIPPLAGVAAFAATLGAARRMLRDLP
ncbi:MAG: cell division protein FtsX [Pseudomonadota bacterium]